MTIIEQTAKKNNAAPTIIVCIDTTNASNTALRYACYRAKLTNYNVQILAVIEGSHKNMLFGSRALGNEKKKDLERHLNKLIDQVYNETLIMPSISIREGHIANEIIKEVKSVTDCVMIILGKSNNSLSDNTVLPKIAQKIGSKIKIPVTIVPETLDEVFLKDLMF
jgi:nucleotide-binding universal stress UspA family protein